MSSARVEPVNQGLFNRKARAEILSRIEEICANIPREDRRRLGSWYFDEESLIRQDIQYENFLQPEGLYEPTDWGIEEIRVLRTEISHIWKAVGTAFKYYWTHCFTAAQREGVLAAAFLNTAATPGGEEFRKYLLDFSPNQLNEDNGNAFIKFIDTSISPAHRDSAFIPALSDKLRQVFEGWIAANNTDDDLAAHKTVYLTHLRIRVLFSRAMFGLRAASCIMGYWQEIAAPFAPQKVAEANPLSIQNNYDGTFSHSNFSADHPSTTAGGVAKKSSKKKKSNHRGKKGKAVYQARKKERRALESFDEECPLDLSMPDPNNIWTHSAYRIEKLDEDAESVSVSSDGSFKAHQDQFIQENKVVDDLVPEDHALSESEYEDLMAIPGSLPVYAGSVKSDSGSECSRSPGLLATHRITELEDDAEYKDAVSPQNALALQKASHRSHGVSEAKEALEETENLPIFTLKESPKNMESKDISDLEEVSEPPIQIPGEIKLESTHYSESTDSIRGDAPTGGESPQVSLSEIQPIDQGIMPVFGETAASILNKKATTYNTEGGNSSVVFEQVPEVPELVAETAASLVTCDLVPEGHHPSTPALGRSPEIHILNQYDTDLAHDELSLARDRDTVDSNGKCEFLGKEEEAMVLIHSTPVIGGSNQLALIGGSFALVEESPGLDAEPEEETIGTTLELDLQINIAQPGANKMARSAKVYIAVPDRIFRKESSKRGLDQPTLQDPIYNIIKGNKSHCNKRKKGPKKGLYQHIDESIIALELEHEDVWDAVFTTEKPLCQNSLEPEAPWLVDDPALVKWHLPTPNQGKLTESESSAPCNLVLETSPRPKTYEDKTILSPDQEETPESGDSAPSDRVLEMPPYLKTFKDKLMSSEVVLMVEDPNMAKESPPEEIVQGSHCPSPVGESPPAVLVEQDSMEDGAGSRGETVESSLEANMECPIFEHPKEDFAGPTITDDGHFIEDPKVVGHGIEEGPGFLERVTGMLRHSETPLGAHINASKFQKPIDVIDSISLASSGELMDTRSQYSNGSSYQVNDQDQHGQLNQQQSNHQPVHYQQGSVQHANSQQGNNYKHQNGGFYYQQDRRQPRDCQHQRNNQRATYQQGRNNRQGKGNRGWGNQQQWKSTHQDRYSPQSPPRIYNGQGQYLPQRGYPIHSGPYPQQTQSHPRKCGHQSPAVFQSGPPFATPPCRPVFPPGLSHIYINGVPRYADRCGFPENRGIVYHNNVVNERSGYYGEAKVDSEIRGIVKQAHLSSLIFKCDTCKLPITHDESIVCLACGINSTVRFCDDRCRYAGADHWKSCGSTNLDFETDYHPFPYDYPGPLKSTGENNPYRYWQVTFLHDYPGFDFIIFDRGFTDGKAPYAIRAIVFDDQTLRNRFFALYRRAVWDFNEFCVRLLWRVVRAWIRKCGWIVKQGVLETQFSNEFGPGWKRCEGAIIPDTLPTEHEWSQAEEYLTNLSHQEGYWNIGCAINVKFPLVGQEPRVPFYISERMREGAAVSLDV